MDVRSDHVQFEPVTLEEINLYSSKRGLFSRQVETHGTRIQRKD